MKTGWRFKGEKDCEPLHYDWCGLDDVYLLSGYKRDPAEDGDDIIIQDMDGLHRAIAFNLARNKKALNGKEVRFLRHQMDLTQAELGQIIGVSDQMIARYEKGEFEIPGPAEMLLRLLYLGHINQALDVRKLAEELRAKDDPAIAKQIFQETDKGWQPLAA